MRAPQIIRTAAGEELVVIPKSDYDELIAAYSEAEEDAADLAIYDARKKELEEGSNAALPAEVSASLLRGDSLLKAFRKWRGMTQIDLAKAAGLGQGYLSDLESRRRGGTPETLASLATALDIDPAWLVE
ncbi:helix-turn-helix domain-containing protein [Beijerinckia indica]|uniref:Helix-turn-helix domain protein n=1 Tax=Beijerinckia indica subsp. indica (strain ATCC 9039 / DSM 1715 / NCIMB 8712) TaxID=395963 RepID=B2IHY0_BEII9|nr:helix-turn-helix transcriptional regulator [Beijerinckia indica]ACB96023.1 helix-turn-helix domain protein [Beijerinckia indica subsp. indica ATCC 9039]